MRFRLCAASLIFAVFAFAATPPPKTPAKTASKTPAKTPATPIASPIAPATIPHPMALFLGELSKSGQEKVSFRASARGTHFFFEEASGVTVYVYDDATVSYRKETFLKGATLATALKKY